MFTMAARIRTVYSKWRVGADDSVRPDDDRTLSDRGRQSRRPLQRRYRWHYRHRAGGAEPLPYEANADDVPIQAAGCGHPALRNGHR